MSKPFCFGSSGTREDDEYSKKVKELVVIKTRMKDLTDNTKVLIEDCKKKEMEIIEIHYGKQLELTNEMAELSKISPLGTKQSIRAHNNLNLVVIDDDKETTKVRTTTISSPFSFP